MALAGSWEGGFLCLLAYSTHTKGTLSGTLAARSASLFTAKLQPQCSL